MLLFALLGLPVSGHGPTAGAGGVLTLDVYGQGDVLDLLVAEAEGERFVLRHRRSTDGGATWASERPVDPGSAAVARPHRGSDPQIAADGGRSWRPGPNPSDSGSTGGHGYADLLVDGGERLHALVWTGADERAGLYLSRSDDAGRSWGAARPVAGGDGHRGDLAAGGVVLAAAWDGATDGGRRIAASLSADGGRTWSEPRMLSAPAAHGSQPLVVRTAGAFRAFWIEDGPRGRAVWASAPFG